MKKYVMRIDIRSLRLVPNYLQEYIVEFSLRKDDLTKIINIICYMSQRRTLYERNRIKASLCQHFALACPTYGVFVDFCLILPEDERFDITRADIVRMPRRQLPVRFDALESNRRR